ncbi:MAG: hypothetical protein H0T80_07305 [Betaproteobacteria bacterium]|nr:hypothetical protein [Betaproteobacteria bacterium]MBA3775939.1 hypothetical protein [Betaproteobacteria bacterium]
MELTHLHVLLAQAKKLIGKSEFVVVGNLSILGVVGGGKAPPRMLTSIDVDCFTRQDPKRIFELQRALGQGSPFEAKHGFYLEPMDERVPTLPEQWESRLVRVPLDDGIMVFFLDLNDAAVSKYARGEPRDREWIQAGLGAALLSAPVIESRFRQTDFFDADEHERAIKALVEDRARFDPALRKGRGKH